MDKRRHKPGQHKEREENQPNGLETPHSGQTEPPAWEMGSARYLHSRFVGILSRWALYTRVAPKSRCSTGNKSSKIRSVGGLDSSVRQKQQKVNSSSKTLARDTILTVLVPIPAVFPPFIREHATKDLAPEGLNGHALPLPLPWLVPKK